MKVVVIGSAGKPEPLISPLSIISVAKNAAKAAADAVAEVAEAVALVADAVAEVAALVE